MYYSVTQILTFLKPPLPGHRIYHKNHDQISQVSIGSFNLKNCLACHDWLLDIHIQTIKTLRRLLTSKITLYYAFLKKAFFCEHAFYMF